MVEIFDNIRAIYHFSRPCEELVPFVEFFSESSAEATTRYTDGLDFTVTMFPSWTPTCWINLGSPYDLSLGEKRFTIGSQNDVLVLRDNITTRHNQPSDHIFTIKFFPGSLEAILGIAQPRMTDRVVALQDILPPRLIHDIRHAASFSERCTLIQDFLISSLGRRRPQDHYTALVADSIALYKSDLRINTTMLAEKLFVTSKTINRYFHQVIGTSPKKYFTLLRARTALSAFVADRSQFSPTDHGYYDMSHFYKEAHRFTGPDCPFFTCRG